MPTLYAILFALLSLPPHSTDTETPVERFVRMSTVAQAIDSAVRRATCFEIPEPCKRAWRGAPVELTADLIEVADAESGLAEDVHSGARTGDKGRSLGLWQLQANKRLVREVWATIVGTDLASTSLAAWHATLALSSATLTCNYRGSRGRAARFALYGTGSVCETEWSAGRARKAERIQRELVRMSGGAR